MLMEFGGKGFNPLTSQPLRFKGGGKRRERSLLNSSDRVPSLEERWNLYRLLFHGSSY